MEQRDIPIQTLKDDEFGIEKYVNALRDFIRNSGTPSPSRFRGNGAAESPPLCGSWIPCSAIPPSPPQNGMSPSG